MFLRDSSLLLHSNSFDLINLLNLNSLRVHCSLNIGTVIEARFHAINIGLGEAATRGSEFLPRVTIFEFNKTLGKHQRETLLAQAFGPKLGAHLRIIGPRAARA